MGTGGVTGPSCSISLQPTWPIFWLSNTLEPSILWSFKNEPIFFLNVTKYSASTTIPCREFQTLSTLRDLIPYFTFEKRAFNLVKNAPSFAILPPVKTSPGKPQKQLAYFNNTPRSSRQYTSNVISYPWLDNHLISEINFVNFLWAASNKSLFFLKYDNQICALYSKTHQHPVQS